MTEGCILRPSVTLYKFFMKNQILFPFLFLFCLAGCRNNEDQLQASYQRAVDWMWAQQASDGGWHSGTHAVLSDGTVLTPYILFHLLQLPDQDIDDHDENIEKAVSFIIRSMQSASGDSFSLKDYPNYAAAYALKVLHILKRDKNLQDALAGYLISQQFTEHRGFTRDSIVYGGWGFGEPGLSFGRHGHVDVSHTRRVSEALHESGYLHDTLKNKVLMFLQGVQRSPDDGRNYNGCASRKDVPYDGGFVSSMVTLSTNKSQPVVAGDSCLHYPSYATATCDGFLALHNLDQEGTKSYEDAKAWLTGHDDMKRVEGLDASDQWSEIMHYYHLAVRSQAMRIIDPGGEWKKDIAQIITREQLPDGSFINPIGGVNKEDDPLMATIFCISALYSSQ